MLRNKIYVYSAITVSITDLYKPNFRSPYQKVAWGEIWGIRLTRNCADETTIFCGLIVVFLSFTHFMNLPKFQRSDFMWFYHFLDSQLRYCFEYMKKQFPALIRMKKNLCFWVLSRAYKHSWIVFDPLLINVLCIYSVEMPNMLTISHNLTLRFSKTISWIFSIVCFI